MEVCRVPYNTMTATDKIITLNVGGIRHNARLSTLLKRPGTRLGILAKLGRNDESYEVTTDEYFFDRHPFAFLQILEYYRTDELHMSENICGNAMQKELEYWGIYETEIETCCWGNYSKLLEARETLANLDSTFGASGEPEDIDPKSLSSLKRCRMIVWNNLEYPSTSRGAKLLMMISIMFVMVSIVSFILESHHWFQVYANDTSIEAPDPELYTQNLNYANCDNYVDLGPAPEVQSWTVFRYIEWTCLSYFMFELVIRFIFAPAKCKFLKTPLNIIDIICILPQAISVLIEYLPQLAHLDGTASDVLKTITVLRTVRVLRIFKLMKHYSAFKVLAYTIKVSTKELMLMVVMLLIGVVICASAIYYAERENFPSIPIALWWALVTMTTVGYGDRVPKQPAGYLIGCVCVIGGVLVIAFTVPIVVNNFTLYYSHAQSRTKLPVTKKPKPDRKSSMVSVSPTKMHRQNDKRTFSTISTDDNNIDEITNNLNIKMDKEKWKLAAFAATKPTNHHAVEATKLVENLVNQEKQSMHEKRRQYMMAFKKMEAKRKGRAE